MKFIKRHINEGFFPNKQQMKDKAEANKDINSADLVANKFNNQIVRIIKNANQLKSICPISVMSLFFKDKSYVGLPSGIPKIKLNDINIKIDTSNAKNKIVIDFIYGGFTFNGELKNVLSIKYTDEFLTRLENIPSRTDLDAKMKVELLKNISKLGISDAVYSKFISNSDITFGKIYLYDNTDERRAEFFPNDTITIELGQGYISNMYNYKNSRICNIGNSDVRKHIENNALTIFSDIFEFSTKRKIKIVFGGARCLNNFTVSNETKKTLPVSWGSSPSLVNKNSTDLFPELFSKYPSFSELLTEAGVSKSIFNDLITCAEKSLDIGDRYESITYIDLSSVSMNDLEWSVEYIKKYEYELKNNKFVYNESRSDDSTYIHNIKVKQKGQFFDLIHITVTNSAGIWFEISKNIVDDNVFKLCKNATPAAAIGWNAIRIVISSKGKYGKYFDSICKEWTKLNDFIKNIIP